MNAQPAATFRFAPSPNGALHLGHARSALITDRMARAIGGRFLVRIEDIDVARVRPEYVAWIEEDLAWLGLSWETPVLCQSEHFATYQDAVRKLDHLGVLYSCFATRAEIAALADPRLVDPDGAPLYPGLWRGRPDVAVAQAHAQGLPFARRLDMAKAEALARQRLQGAPLMFRSFDADGSIRDHQVNPACWGDVILVRKETPTSYHLSVVVDDARQGVTHVTRGADLLAATDLHRLLQVLLDLPAPLYHHHSLIVDASGRKLSKSAGDTSLRALRASGWSREDVIARALQEH